MSIDDNSSMDSQHARFGVWLFRTISLSSSRKSRVYFESSLRFVRVSPTTTYRILSRTINAQSCR